ncbi:MAG: FAD-binding protein [Bacteroidetes bacterium]|nr:FAD-binding protein [Bacteroidota bacterium]HET6242993.1 NAD(P)/FAD-dependent oxidoreductase [Bacteroidia bacterium]
MQKELNLVVSPENSTDTKYLIGVVAEMLQVEVVDVSFVKILKRSIDARSRNVKIQLRVLAFVKEPEPQETIPGIKYEDVRKKTPVIIIGAGPAGLFAALKLIERGFKPVILERGKNVRERRRDLAALNKQHIVNPDSNYCFGEGGAGTYSDGKLYTRSTKRGDVQDILNTLVFHGANADILIDSHPHIGTNKLPSIIVSIRESIINAGGEVHFNTRVTDFIINKGNFEGVTDNNQNEFRAKGCILATGHSARDIFRLLYAKEILIEAKPFAMGVRIEHPQHIIDSIQYHCNTRSEFLPPASYNLVQQVKDRGVYSFCMCPGGIIAPCATSDEEVVTNGWSPSKRNNPYANSGIVVSVEPDDLRAFSYAGVFAGLQYQQEYEKMAFTAGGKTQTAPAQRLEDFVKNKLSKDLPSCSYQPGIISAPLHQLLPEPIRYRLQEGFKAFGAKMKGYYTNEAVIVGVESRTSSPIRIPRDKLTLEHPQIKGLYPCGEGAGYAGGIVSAAIDGIKCAEAIQ